jgi:hypothetical protein
MKKLFVLFAALAALAASLAGSAFAGAPVANVTGDVTFNNGGISQHWAFNAQDLGNNQYKGNVLDEYNGGTTISKILSVHVIDAHTATFTTQVTSNSNNPYANVGDQFSYRVYDTGEGANAPADSFDYLGVTRGGVFIPADPNNSHFVITSGNIQIH